MRTNLKKVLAMMLSLILMLSFIAVNDINIYAATGKVSSIKVTNLKKKTLTLSKGQKKTLNVKVTVKGKKISKDFTVKTGNKKVATVKKSGKKVIITAKNNGNADITITSKANKKKKVVIKVTVKTPVKNITMSTTKSTIKLGSTLQLKATVSSDASNKNLTWSSSDATVATVSSTGLVTAKKIGTTTITATAQDGSGKKASCVVTVNNPNSIASVKVIRTNIIEVNLAYAQKLSKENFTVDRKFYDRGNYLGKRKIDYIESSDNKTYIIYLQDGFSYQEYIRVSISGLSGVSGAATKETVYTLEPKTHTRDMSFEMTCGDSFAERIYPEYMSGSFTYTTTAFPAGIKILKEYLGVYTDSIKIEGTPSKAGVYKTTITCKDEMGNVEIINLTFVVGDDNKIFANTNPGYYYTRNYDYVYITKYFSDIIDVAGGSGSYKYEVEGDLHGLTLSSNSNYLSGEIREPGTYSINIKVTDKNNENLSTNVVWSYSLKKGMIISGTVKDAEGEILQHGNVYFYNVDTNDKYVSYGECSIKSDGTYQIAVPAGTYDIIAYSGNAKKYVGRKTITTDLSDMNFSIPVYVINVSSDNTDITSFNTWYDKDGNSLGSGNTLYLRAGNYSLNSEGSVFISDYLATLNITVNKNMEVTANITTTPKILPTIIVGQTISTKLTYDNSYYKFVPTETGTYYFYSTGNYNTYGYVYDETGQQLKADDETGVNSNFEIAYTFTAGTTYYLAAKYKYTNTISASVTVSTTTSNQ